MHIRDFSVKHFVLEGSEKNSTVFGAEAHFASVVLDNTRRDILIFRLGHLENVRQLSCQLRARRVLELGLLQ